MVSLLLVVVCLFLHVASSLNCITVIGSTPGSNIGETSIATCPLNYQIVSCGIKSTSQYNHGTHLFTNNNTCVTKNPPNGGLVVSYARCCTLASYDISCSLHEGIESDASDNTESIISCPDVNSTLMGCNTFSFGDDIDGGWPGESTYSDNADGITIFDTYNRCISRNGWSGLGVSASSICCNSSNINVNIDCITIWGIQSNTSINSWSNVSCPINYTMTSCQAYSWWNVKDRAYVDPDDESCSILSIGGGVSYVNAAAICCKVETRPTMQPTIQPTIQPIIQPTSTPSVIPTKVPSHIPTKLLTLLPTNTPSTLPTRIPTMPTTIPTTIPTKIPTEIPTDNPTRNPSRVITPTLVIGTDPTSNPINTINTVSETTTMETVANKENTNDGPLNEIWLIILAAVIIFLCVFILILVLLLIFCQKKQGDDIPIIDFKVNVNHISNGPTNTQSGIPMVKVQSVSTVLPGMPQVQTQQLNDDHSESDNNELYEGATNDMQTLQSPLTPTSGN